MSDATQEVLLDDDLIDEDFNDALSNLQKSLESDGSLQKAGKMDDGEKRKPKSKKAEEDEEESEGEEEEDMNYEKSISDILDEDPEASTAMDVEPFLRQLAKAMDETVSAAFAVVMERVGKVEELTKSMANAVVQVGRLEKSTKDIVEKIGGQPMPRKGAVLLGKSRFEGNDGKKDFDNKTVLIKSREWVRSGKIDLTEAGMIEGRINKGNLGKRNDMVDQKVAALMKED